MASGETLIDLIRKVIAQTGNDGFICGEVTDVDTKTLTCSVKLDDNLIIEGCRLNAVECQKQGHCFAVIPKKGSFVSAVATADLRDILIVSFSEIDRVIINAPKIEVNDFKTQLDKMSARIDGIIDAINNGKATPHDGGAGLQQTIVLGLQQITDKEDFDTLADYEGTTT
ncbi:MAG: hypothetical protein IKP73_12190 [Bacteroidales bacterium]|nr:hypothetical protein [Bacteroidales bacterium]